MPIAGLSATQYANLLLSNITATISGNILVGQIGGIQPTSNVGPWLNGNSWWFWNAALSSYQPGISTAATFFSTINGDFQAWQRGTSFAAIATDTYGPDMWRMDYSVGTAVFAVTQQASGILAGAYYPDTLYCCQVQATTAQATITANQYAVLTHTVSRNRARKLFDQQSALQFALRANFTGSVCVAIQNMDTSESYVFEAGINSANSWIFFTVPQIPNMPYTVGSWGSAETDAAYMIRFVFASGTTFQTSAGAWTSGNKLCTSNQSNMCATLGQYVQIALVGHQAGPNAGNFPTMDLAATLRDCRVYFRKSYDPLTAPGTATYVGCFGAYGPSVTNVTTSVCFDPPMRTTPTMVFYSPANGATGNIMAIGTAGNATCVINVNFPALGNTGFGCLTVSTSTGPWVGQYTADASYY